MSVPVPQRIFRPSPGNTKVVTVSATATSVAFLGSGANFRVVNATGGIVLFGLGDSTYSATTSDTPILSGSAEVFTRDPSSETNISIRTVSGTGTVYVQDGEGS